MALLLVVGLICGQVASSAQGVEAVVEPPRWSVGAGLGFGPGAVVITSGAVLGTAGFVASPTLSVERRLGDHLALGLTVLGTYRTGALAGVPWGVSAPGPDNQSGSVSVGVGPRWIVTGPGAPVDFSLSLAAGVGYSTAATGGAGLEPQRLEAFTASLAVGAAVERRLLDWLGLRVGAQLVELQYRRSIATVTATPEVPGSAATSASSGLAVNVLPVPSLELRFSF